MIYKSHRRTVLCLIFIERESLGIYGCLFRDDSHLSLRHILAMTKAISLGSETKDLLVGRQEVNQIYLQ